MLLLRWNLFSSSHYNIYSKNRDEIHNLASLHVLNHVLTSRTRVQRHNRRIRELASARDGGGGGGDDDDVDRWRDQGYARPKVLVLLPTRGACRVFVESMVRLLGASAIVDNMDRFRAEYGPVGGGGADGGGADGGGRDGGAAGGDLAGARRAAVLRQKGPEWNELFGDDADDDDDFKTGLSLTPNYVGPPPPFSSSTLDRTL